MNRTPAAPTPRDDLALCHRLADAADEITVHRYQATDLRVTSKPDATPVTDADQSVEQTLRARIEAERPGDAVHGEEYADTGTGPRRWIIDPIDGTKNFLRGVPTWATLISLSVDGEVTAAVVSAPLLGRRWWAGQGLGAFTRTTLPGTPDAPRQIHTSRIADLADASLSYSSLTGWRQLGLLAGFLQLHDTTWRQRAFGDFWSYMLLAEGAVDIAAEPEVALHDLAAVSLIVTEAGGTFTDLHGTPGPDGGSAVATNTLLHTPVLDALHSHR
ncbi:inositol monophosphatase family protein [Streptomyces sp. NPDC058045]|uniref:inositol monophosphatase family protein n=1 Tax=Streptomyces sp. NPDC058045 TaxID=3346311 RepID=UPI0036E7163B